MTEEFKPKPAWIERFVVYGAEVEVEVRFEGTTSPISSDHKAIFTCPHFDIEVEAQTSEEAVKKIRQALADQLGVDIKGIKKLPPR